ncbi:acyl-CoA reductase-like NAD-dependent aldehyde dehydrogenase/thiamine pyrophosphate-dependent acetolactate synthase large subunit-like protein [Bradyrhizobium sp. S3.3.6]
MQEAIRSATDRPHSEATRPTVRGAVCDLMRRFGMTTVFGNPGSTELPLFRNFPDDFRYVLGLQEAVVVGMADGYAQATRNAAFVNLHSAAGVGNAMGNIFTAFKNRTPMVITAGQQARSMLAFDPFLASREATELPKPYVKWSVEPARAEDVPHAIARAYYLAMMPPRGPVLVSVPVDDWDRPAEYLPVRLVSQQTRPDPIVLDQIAQALDGATSPVFVVGGAVDRDSAFSEVVRLAEAHNARVVVAPMSGRCSFPEDHRLFAGFLPAMREKIVGLLKGADLVFAIGAPAFTYHVEGFGAHVPAGATLVQLTDDPQTAAWTPLGMAAVGSIRLGLIDLLARAKPPARIAPPPRAAAPRARPTAPLSTAYLLQSLAERRPVDSIIVEEAPTSRPVMHAHLPILRSEGFYTMDSGGLGYGMPAAVGVALGKRGTRVIGVIGDGSSLYSNQAVWSAAQLSLPITFVIVNNGRYAALQDFASVFGFGSQEPVQGTDLPGLDFVAIAKGMGCPAVRVRDAETLHDALDKAFASDGPMLIDVQVDDCPASKQIDKNGEKTMNAISMLIDGQPRPAAAGATFERKNPLDSTVATRAPAATPADAVAAVRAAARAFPSWSTTGPSERRALLTKAAHCLEAKADAFAAAIAAETGGSALWSGFNVHLAAGMLIEAAAMTTQIGGEIIPSNVPGSLAMGVRQPAGVVLGMAPWNAPVILGVRALALPLACGNTAVLKGSELCPATHGLIVEAFREAGFPAGVVNYVTNAPTDAASIVAAMIAEPSVRRVNFTGSTRVGKIIAGVCAKYLKPAVLELGGKAPLLVLDDADLDAAVNAAAFGAFANSGQICMSTERIIVDESIADDFVQRLADKASQLPLGDPRRGPVVLGSVVDMATVDRCNELIDDALAKGARLLCGGKAESTLMPATLLDQVTADMRIYSEESFGPVKPIVRVKGEEAAIACANDNAYGLSSAVFTGDSARGLRVAAKIESGICHINGPTVHDEAQMPFGGVKESGFGRFGGKAGIAEFTELRWVTMQTTPRHYPF